MRCDEVPQHAIQNLRLLTDWSCEDDENRQGIAATFGLETFASLQSFCWIGIRQKVEFQLLGACLKASRGNLQELTLDLTSWEMANVLWHKEDIDEYNYQARVANRSPNFFARKVLGIAPRVHHVVFQKLRKLFLSYVPFATMTTEMACAMNSSDLTTLIL